MGVYHNTVIPWPWSERVCAEFPFTRLFIWWALMMKPKRRRRRKLRVSVMNWKRNLIEKTFNKLQNDTFRKFRRSWVKPRHFRKLFWTKNKASFYTKKYKNIFFALDIDQWYGRGGGWITPFWALFFCQWLSVPLARGDPPVPCGHRRSCCLTMFSILVWTEGWLATLRQKNRRTWFRQREVQSHSRAILMAHTRYWEHDTKTP